MRRYLVLIIASGTSILIFFIVTFPLFPKFSETLPSPVKSKEFVAAIASFYLQYRPAEEKARRG